MRQSVANRWWLRLFFAGLVLLVGWGAGEVAQASGSPAAGHGAPAAAEPLPESDSPIRGIELGEFRIRTHYLVEAKRSTVTFKLYAIVASEQAAEFRHVLENRRHKTRDQVIIATRLAPLRDFDDAELKEFRRRILLRLRRMLPELAMDDIYVSQFHFEVRGL